MKNWRIEKLENDLRKKGMGVDSESQLNDNEILDEFNEIKSGETGRMSERKPKPSINKVDDWWPQKVSEMRILILPVIAVFTVGLFAASDVFAQDTEFVIPDWVKNIAKYWHEDSIDDDTFIGTLKYLIQHEILILPETDTKSTESEIPA